MNYILDIRKALGYILNWICPLYPKIRYSYSKYKSFQHADNMYTKRLKVYTSENKIKDLITDRYNFVNIKLRKITFCMKKREKL